MKAPERVDEIEKTIGELNKAGERLKEDGLILLDK